MKKIESEKAINYGWDTVKADFWYFVGISLLYLVLTSIGSNYKNHNPIWFNLLPTLITAYLAGGFIKMFFKLF